MEMGQKQLIDACIAEGIPRFMDSGYTFDYRPLKRGAAPQKDFCKDVQAYLESKADQIKSVQILNGAFTEVCFAPFYGLWDPQGPMIRFWGNGDEKLEMTTYEAAASFAAEIALDKNAVGYQSGKFSILYSQDTLLLTIPVLGDRKSVKEIAATIEAEYGVNVDMQRLGSLEDLYTAMKNSMAKEPQNMYAWMGMNYYYHGLNGSTYLPKDLDANRYPELKVTRLEDFLKKYDVKTLGDAYMF